MSTPLPPETPETPETPAPKGPRSPRKTAIDVGIGLGVAMILITLGWLFPPDKPKPAPVTPPPVASAAPLPPPDGGPSRYAFCEEIHALFVHAKSAHGCKTDNWPIIRAVCEIGLVKKRDCEPALSAATACARAAPETGWGCDAKGVVELTACGPQQAALDQCLNP